MGPTFFSALDSMRYETKEHRSYVMSRISSKGTRPETLVRKGLFRKGFRYRLNVKELPGCPDIVLPKYHTAIFVHGCFWHGHKGCKSYSIPKTNTEFWTAKVARNQQRDQEVWRQLEAKGWYVIIVWECELKKAKFEDTVCRVQKEIIKNGEAYLSAKEERRRSRDTYNQERRIIKTREAELSKELKDIFK